MTDVRHQGSSVLQQLPSFPSFQYAELRSDSGRVRSRGKPGISVRNVHIPTYPVRWVGTAAFVCPWTGMLTCQVSTHQPMPCSFLLQISL